MHRRIDRGDGGDRRDGFARFTRGERVFGDVFDLHGGGGHRFEVADGHLDIAVAQDEIVEAGRGGTKE